jgi:two-component sensor histidine kinase
VKDALHNADNRVMAISSVHRQLNLTGDGRTVIVPQFLEQLCTGLQRSGGGRIAVSVAADSMTMDGSQAISLGLIVNELVTNAIKYAYPQGRGTVEVALKTSEAGWTLTVSDSGPTQNVKESADRSNGLGMRVIKSSAVQLDATVDIENLNPGTAFIVKSGATR